MFLCLKPMKSMATPAKPATNTGPRSNLSQNSPLASSMTALVKLWRKTARPIVPLVSLYRYTGRQVNGATIGHVEAVRSIF